MSDDVNFDELNAGLSDWAKQNRLDIKQQQALAVILKKQKLDYTDMAKVIKDLNKNITKGSAGYKEQLHIIDTLNDQIEELIENTTDENRIANKAIIAEKEVQKATLETSVKMQGLSESIDKTTSGFIKGATTTIGAFAKGLQGNQSTAELSAGLMTSVVGVATAGVKGFGMAGEAAGNAMMKSSNKWVQGLGGVTSAVGSFAGKSAEAIGEIVKFGIAVAQIEVEKTVKAFNQVSSSGAMFVDGMMGMRTAAGNAGLTVEDFSNVIKTNSGSIASAGMGMTEGTKKIGKALQAGGTDMKTHLLNLGFSLEDQAGLVADVMKDMRGSSTGPLKASNAQVAAETQKYAENLRVLTAITGEDAKVKMEESRKKASQLMFQQKLNELEPAQRKAAMEAFNQMSGQQQDNFMDMVNFSNVINTSGAILNSTSAGMSDSLNQSVTEFRNGTLDFNSQLKNNQAHGEQINSDILKMTGVAAANAAKVSGAASDTAASGLDTMNFYSKFTKQGIADSLAARKGQENNSDKLTSNLTDAELAAYQLKIKMQEMMDVPISKFAATSKLMLDAIKTTLDKMGMGLTGDEADSQEPSWFKKHTKGIIIGAATLAGGAIGGIAAGGVTAGVGAIPGAIAGATEGATLGLAAASMLGYAKGGIATGPVSGYVEKLHGTEAVVPLPDGRSIPVTLDSSSITNSINQQNSILNSILDTLQKNNQLTSGILQQAY